MNVIGSWPARVGPSSASIAACSSGVSTKPNRSRFCFCRSTCADLGMMIVPFSICQRRITCAGVTPCAAAIRSIERIAAAHGVTPAQVILRWHIENGTIIIPKSAHVERQKQNLDLFGFVLTPEEHAAIDALDGPTRAGHDPMTFTYA